MKALLLGSLEVLTDTSHLWRSANRRAFSDHGIDFSRRAGHAPLSRPMPRPGDDTSVPVADILGSRNAHYAEALARVPLRPRPRLIELLDAAQDRGIALGLICDAPSDWTVSVFDGLGLAPERFDAIVVDDHLTSRKPSPDCYHLAAAMMATAPEDCLAAEIDRLGVAGARACGMSVLDLTARNTDPVAAMLAALPDAGLPTRRRDGGSATLSAR
jgi:HAD superfamily hydrolase (TIGR01509 family)